MNDIERYVKSFIGKGYEYEIFRQRVKKLKIEVCGGKVESISSSEESGISIRVLKDRKIGFAYTSQPNSSNLKDVVEKAMEMCDLQNPDRGNEFLRELKETEIKSVFDEEGVRRSLDEKEELTLDLERRTKSLDKRIKGVRKASFTESIFEIEVRNSYGVSFGYEGTYYSAMVAALAQENGDSAISWEFRGTRRLKDLNIEDLVKDVVFKSTALLNPKPFSTKVVPVVFFRESSAMLLESVASVFLGDSYVKGKTLLKGKVGESVGSEVLTIVDDGTLKDGFATTPYDAEGVPRKKNVVIEKGVFRGFLHSLYTALLSGEEPTGSSERKSYRNLPAPGITNLYIAPGKIGFEELLELEEEIFLVVDLMGLHTVDPVSGEFSLGASGILFRRGKPQHAVRGVTVAGNVLDLWNKIVAVGNDLKFFGNLGSPSLLVKDVTVGGS